MEHETDGEIDRHPRQVEQRDRADAGEEHAHGVEIAQRLQPFALAADLERQPDDGVVDARAQGLVEAVADAHQDAAADEVDEALREVEAGDEDEQRDQRRHAAARQHAVVDFQHEQRAGEHQDVAHAGKQRNRQERPLAGAERGCELGAGGRRGKGAGGLGHDRCLYGIP